jgi:hypothetical protein
MRLYPFQQIDRRPNPAGGGIGTLKRCFSVRGGFPFCPQLGDQR